MRQRAFSIVELLISVTLIAVLVALTALGAKSWRAQSQAVQCLQNLRMIGAAFALYAADHGNRIPPRNLGLYRPPGTPKPPGHLRAWASRLINLGYADNPDLFYCPSFFPRNSKEARRDVRAGAAETYGIRIWLRPGADKDDPEREEEQLLSLIKQPSDFFLVVDSIWLDAGWRSQGYGVSTSKAPGGSPQQIHTRHHHRANTLFADGHVAPKDADYFKNLIHTQPEYSDGRHFSVYEEATLP